MDIKKLKKDTYGKKIKLPQANEMINEFLELDKIMIKSIDSKELDPKKRKRAEELKARECNAFIFHKDLIARFFDGTERDDQGNPISSEYLMVILGAHAKDEKVEDIKAGSFTVITTGCNLAVEKVDGVDVAKFYPINTLADDPANEYPPRQVITNLSFEGGPFDGMIKYFLVTK